VCAAQNEKSWRRSGGHFLADWTGFDGLSGSFLRLDDRFLEFKLLALQILSFFLQIHAFDSPYFGGLLELLRFEANFDVTPFFS